MPKKFITEQDIEKLAQQGVKSLEITPDVVLTDLAFEKARRLGIEMVNQMDTPPAAPVRPYISRDPRMVASPRPVERPVEMVKSVVAAAVIPAPAPALNPILPAPATNQPLPAANPVPAAEPVPGLLAARIRHDVNTRLEGKIDPALLERILRRVLENVGVK